MKRLLLFFFAFTVLFIACEEDDPVTPVPPEISVDGGGASMSVLVNTEFSIAITAKSGNSDLATFEIWKKGETAALLSQGITADLTGFNYTHKETIETASTVTFIFKIIDKNGQAAQVEQEVVVKEPAPPTIAIKDGDPTKALAVAVSKEFSISVMAEAGTSDLATLEVWKKGENTATVTEQLDGTTPFTYTYKETPATTGSTTYVFKVIDKANANATVEWEVKVEDALSASEVTLLAPSGDKTSNTFYSINEAKLYSYNDVVNTAASVSPNIDLGYYNNDTDGASIASPSVYTLYDLSAWGTKNETSFIKVTTEYDMINTKTDVMNAYTAGTGASSIKSLVANDVVVFKTAKDTYGVFMVAEIKGTFNVGDYIKVKMKVAK